jgi:ADP-heptose:LPS heptosyltransferase
MMKKLRRAARQHGGRLLAAVVGREPANPPLDAASLRRIVVVRMNGRMGNTLFLTPLLTAISHALPAATIDLVVLYPEAGELLRGLPGVGRVMVLPHKGWWRLRRSLATLRAIRSERYDLAIDPSPDSLGGRLALMFCRARSRLGFGGRNQWAALTHAVDVPPGMVHEALRPLALLDLLPQPPGPRPEARLRLALGGSELEAGRERIEASLAACAVDRPPGRPVIGFFAYARGSKSLGAEWWQRFWQRFLVLEPGAIPLEVLPSAACPPVLQGRPALHLASPRQLAATMASMQLFVSADTGPMHLASSTRVPVAALFGPTAPARFGPLKPEDTVILLEGRSPEEIAEACRSFVQPAAATAAGPQPRF